VMKLAQSKRFSLLIFDIHWSPFVCVSFSTTFVIPRRWAINLLLRAEKSETPRCARDDKLNR
jgi:hypothetical protein